MYIARSIETIALIRASNTSDSPMRAAASEAIH